MSRFEIDPLDGDDSTEQFARDLFGSDTTVAIRDNGQIIVYCHESLARKVIDALTGQGGLE